MPKQYKYKQTGTRKSIVRDKALDAKLPGWRESKSGNEYFENRMNRSDRKGSKL